VLAWTAFPRVQLLPVARALATAANHGEDDHGNPSEAHNVHECLKEDFERHTGSLSGELRLIQSYMQNS